MKENLIQIKSYSFAVKIVNLCNDLIKNQKEFILSKQLLRSATSVGANIEEAIGGQSRRDFFFKLTISYKDARESHYWLRLLKDTGYISPEKQKEYLEDCEEILRIIGKIQKTMRESNNNS